MYEVLDVTVDEPEVLIILCKLQLRWQSPLWLACVWRLQKISPLYLLFFSLFLKRVSSDSNLCLKLCLCNGLWTLVYQPHGYISPSCSTCPFIATVSRMTLQKFFRDVPLSLLWCQISFLWRGKGDERASGWVAFSWRLSHKYWGVRLSIGVCTTHCAGVLCVLSVELGMAHDFQNKAKPVCVSHKELPLACNWRLTRSYVVAEICWRFNSRELCISVMLVWSSLWL